MEISKSIEGNTSSNYPLQPDPTVTLDDQPKWRMGNAPRLLEIVRAADKSESRARFLDVCSEVDDVYDRKPPDDPYELSRDGLAWTNNIDWGGMEFGVDSAIAPEFNLLHMPETYIKLETVYEGVDHSQQKRTVETEDRRMLDEWEEWLPELGKMLLQRKKYGLGIFYFRHPRSWHFQSLHPGNLLTNSPSINPGRWSWCAIHTEYDISDLLKKLNTNPEEDKEGFSRVDGWNRNNIRKAIEKHSRDKGFEIHTESVNDAENWRNEYLTNDLYWSHKNDMVISGYIVYVREFDGKITEYLLTKKDDVGFLFRSPEKQRLDQMSDAFCMFPEHCGQNLFREVRGYGIKNLAFFDAENQMNNSMLDSARLSSSLFLQGGTSDDLYNQQEMMVGAITMLPSNLTISASQMPDTSRALLPIMQHLTNLRQNAAGATGGEGAGVGPDRETAKGATLRFQQSQRMQNYSVNFLYKLAEKFHRLRFSRYMGDKMLEADPGYEQAKESLERMAAKGVAEDFVRAIDLKSTSVCRIFGDGDPARLFADLTDLMPTVGSMTEGGKQEYFRDLGHAKMGHDRAKAYFGNQVSDPTLMRNRQQAQVENGMFETADARVDAAGDDNHMVHVSEHVPYLESKVGAMQEQQASPEEIYKTISRAMAHIGYNEDAQPVGGHIVPLMQDPSAEETARDMNQRMAKLINLRRQLEQQIGAQKEAEQQQALENLKMPLEERAKAAKVEHQISIDKRKAEIEIEIAKSRKDALDKEAEFLERKREIELEKLRAETNKAKQQSTNERA